MFGNSSISNSIRGCLQQFYDPGYSGNTGGYIERGAPKQTNKFYINLLAERLGRLHTSIASRKARYTTDETIMDKKLTGVIYVVLGGALAFWVPDVVINFLIHDKPIWPLTTVTLPTSCLVTYVLYWKRSTHAPSPSWMIAGIYFLGPIFMLVSATAQGAGAHTFQHADYWYIPLSMVVPPLTLIQSGYDQSFFALVIVTIVWIILQFAYVHRADNRTKKRGTA